MIRLYADENVERQIVRGLRSLDVDNLIAEEVGFGRTEDSAILDRAGEVGRIVFSRDQDFLREAAIRQSADKQFVGVIYAHKRDVSIGQCVQDLDLLAIAGTPDDFESRVYFLPL